jgi:hypothetical protein
VYDPTIASERNYGSEADSKKGDSLWFPFSRGFELNPNPKLHYSRLFSEYQWAEFH